MTTVRFISANNAITGVIVEGHSGYAPQGEDIVCAAITSAVRMLETTLTQVYHLTLDTKVDEGYVSLFLPASGKAAEVATMVQSSLLGAQLYLTQLQEEYLDYLLVIEESV